MLKNDAKAAANIIILGLNISTYSSYSDLGCTLDRLDEHAFMKNCGYWKGLSKSSISVSSSNWKLSQISIHFLFARLYFSRTNFWKRRNRCPLLLHFVRKKTWRAYFLTKMCTFLPENAFVSIPFPFLFSACALFVSFNGVGYLYCNYQLFFLFLYT